MHEPPRSQGEFTTWTASTHFYSRAEKMGKISKYTSVFYHVMMLIPIQSCLSFSSYQFNMLPSKLALSSSQSRRWFSCVLQILNPTPFFPRPQSNAYSSTPAAALPLYQNVAWLEKHSPQCMGKLCISPSCYWITKFQQKFHFPWNYTAHVLIRKSLIMLLSDPFALSSMVSFITCDSYMFTGCWHEPLYSFSH